MTFCSGVDNFETAGFAGVGTPRASPPSAPVAAQISPTHRYASPTRHNRPQRPKPPPNNTPLRRQPTPKGLEVQYASGPEPSSPESIYEEAEISTASRSKIYTPSIVPTSTFRAPDNAATASSKRRSSFMSQYASQPHMKQSSSYGEGTSIVRSLTEEHFPFDLDPKSGRPQVPKRPLQGILKTSAGPLTIPPVAASRVPPPRPSRNRPRSQQYGKKGQNFNSENPKTPSRVEDPAPSSTKSRYTPSSGPHRPLVVPPSPSASSLLSGSDTAGVTGFPVPPSSTSLPYIRHHPGPPDSPSTGLANLGDLMLNGFTSLEELDLDSEAGMGVSPFLGGPKSLESELELDAKMYDAVERKLHETVMWATEAQHVYPDPIPSITITATPSADSLRALNRRLSRAKATIPPLPPKSHPSSSGEWDPLSQSSHERSQPNYRSATYSIYDMYSDDDGDEEDAMAWYPGLAGASRSADPEEDIGASFAKEMGVTLERIR